MDENEYDSVNWCGDINADFIRNTTFTNTVDIFLEEKLLEKSWEKYPIDYTHTFERDDQTYTSTLDHFFWSESISHQVVEADVLHLLNNISDHSPVYCKVDMATMSPRKTIQRLH